VFAHSYSEDSHEQCIVQSSAGDESRNDMAESSSLSGAGSAFHVDGPATAKLHGS